MRNHRGQALIEFLLIMPIMFIIMMGMFDFGNILYHRYKIENELDYVVSLVQEEKEADLDAYLEENDLVMDISSKEEGKTIHLKTSISIYTPGLNKILGKTYRIDATKTLYE